MDEISLEELNQEAKKRIKDIEQKLEEDFKYENNFSFDQLKKELIKVNKLIQQIKNSSKDNKYDEILKENLAYSQCLELVENSKGIRCKYCGSYNIVPYYYGDLYPDIISSKYLLLDKNFKYGGATKPENWKPYYCKECDSDFNCF